MKILKIICVLCSLMISSMTSYSQVNSNSELQTDRFEPMSLEELPNGPMTLQKKFNENQKYLYQLKKWIQELKPRISEPQFLNRLNKEYNDLTDIEAGDLARATKHLQQSETAVREIISDYYVWVNQQRI